jgi:hypothetical protein
MFARAASALGLLAVLAALTLACGAERQVQVENATDLTLRVTQDGFEIGTWAPSEVRGLSDIRKNSFPDTFEAFAPDGSLVWELTITWDELEAADYLIVITED